MSILDRIVDWGTRQRAPWWVLVVVYWALTVAVLAPFVVVWGVGGSNLRDSIVGSVYGPFGLVAYGTLTRLGPRALDRFLPALGADSPDVARWRRRLAGTSPTGLAVLVVVAAYEPVLIVTGLFSYSEDDTAADIPVVGKIAYAALSTLLGYLANMAWFWAIAKLVVNVALVHRAARHIDPSRPFALHAFAPVTAFAGGSILVITAYQLVTVPGIFGGELAASNRAYIVVSDLIAVVVALLVFIVPLLGMRARIERAKDEMLVSARDSLATASERLRAAVDAGDDAKVPGIRESVAAMSDEVARIKALSTWPWDPRTIRGFASTTTLPVLTWLIIEATRRLLNLGDG